MDLTEFPSRFLGVSEGIYGFFKRLPSKSYFELLVLGTTLLISVLVLVWWYYALFTRV